jgi:hypothetical protein
MVEEKREEDKDKKEDQEDMLTPATKVNNALSWHL